MSAGAKDSRTSIDVPVPQVLDAPGTRGTQDRDVSCWTVTDGSMGMESQCRGLAEALGYQPVIKHVRRHPLQNVLKSHWLPPGLLVDHPGAAAVGMHPPWPDLLISCGRTAAAYSIAIKRRSRGRTSTIHIQNPRVPFELFDLLVVPRHDRITGPNVIDTLGAVHGVTAAKLKDGAQLFEKSLRHLPRPLVAVLIGGASRHFSFGPRDAERMARELLTFAAMHGAGLAISVSRRTGVDAVRVLRQRFNGRLDVHFWDGSGENPYLAYLGLADALIVTADSVSMVSEACATGKPVYIAPVAGRGAPNIRNFYEDFTAAGLIRPFTGKLERWRYTPLDEAGRAAAEIRRRLSFRDLVAGP